MFYVHYGSKWLDWGLLYHFNKGKGVRASRDDILWRSIGNMWGKTNGR